MNMFDGLPSISYTAFTSNTAGHYRELKMDYLDRLKIYKKEYLEALRKAEIELLSSLEEGDEVHFPKELAHRIEPMAALARRIEKEVRVEGLAIIRGAAAPATSACVREFIAEECETGSEFRATTKELYSRFVEYSKRRGVLPLTALVFGRTMNQLGFEYRECSAPKYYSYRRGLRLK